jgi:hypothetical protein
VSNLGRPSLSVILSSIDRRQDLGGYVVALEHACDVTALEALGPEHYGHRARRTFAERVPGVRVLSVSPGGSISHTRTVAFGEAIASTSRPSKTTYSYEVRAREIVEARAGGVRFLGGGVVNAGTERDVKKPALLPEHRHILAPLAIEPEEGPVGNNTAKVK